MNKRTGQAQRKTRIQNPLRRRPKKEKVEKEIAPVDDASCQTQGCGCGN